MKPMTFHGSMYIVGGYTITVDEKGLQVHLDPVPECKMSGALINAAEHEGAKTDVTSVMALVGSHRMLVEIERQLSERLALTGFKEGEVVTMFNQDPGQA